MSSPLAILLLGLLLGIRHAFDPDHLVAVTTIVSEYRNPLRAIWVGVSWGLGHTTTLFLVGVVLLLVNVSPPQGITSIFELLVAVVLVVLGVQTFGSLRRSRVHVHSHQHQEGAHVHFHSHAETPAHSHHFRRWSNLARFLIAGIVPGEHRRIGWRSSLQPFFRVKSYVVGTVHGLAGSSALMLLVLANLESRWLGLWYILLFGLGSVVAMGAVTVLLTMPFSLSARLPWLNRLVQSIAAAFSIIFGLVLMYEVGLTI